MILQCYWAVAAPVITNSIPAAGATVSNLTQVTVFFNQPVTGVDAADFLVNDQPADSVTGPAGTNRYTFNFTQPAAGSVAIAWIETPGIVDLASNPFDPEDAGATWQYNLLDIVAPTIADQAPPPGAIVRSFTQVEVHFSEAVAGVQASDLLVNGQPASQLTILDSDRYLFQFPQPPTGTVQVAWASDHGVQDLATTPNPFAGGNWTNVLDPAYALAQVRINEFLTGNFNTNALKDQFGQLEDWIELYNYGASSVDLTGYSLTDDAAFPGKWVFPFVTLGAGSNLVVFASGRNLTTVGGTNKLHTSFSLSSAGEYLGLYNPESPRAVLSEFAPEYPEQRPNYSYGYDSTNAVKYFSGPSPGTNNNGSSSITGAVAELHFNVEHGFFNQPFQLLLNTATPGATIRYTTNGTPPTESSGTIYSNAILVNRTTTLRALAYKTNLLPTWVGTHTYIYLSNTLNQPTNPPGFPINVWNLSGQSSDYAMDQRVVTNSLHAATIEGDLLSLPALSIVLKTEDMFGGAGGAGIYTNTLANNLTEVPCSLELIHPDGNVGFQIDTGIRQHGGSSRNNPMKKAFTLKFRGKYGDAKLRYQLFPDTPVDEFNSVVLRPDYNNSWTHSGANEDLQRSRGTLVRDAFFKDVHGAMGDLTSHGRYVHLYINGLYWGVYNPCEDPDNDFAAAHLGGDNIEYDAVKAASSSLSVDGDLVAYNAMVGLANAGLANLAQYAQMRQYLDVTQFADYMILQWYGANNDWAAQNNWAAVRKREANATFKWLCWDSERVLEGTNESKIGTSPTSANLQNALGNSAEYKILFADRVHKHMFNAGVLTPSQVTNLWKARAAQIDRAIVGETARWGDASFGGKDALSPLPYPGYTAGFPYTREENWLGEQGRLFNNYFPFRTTIFLNQLISSNWYPTVAAPVFNQFGGRVPSGFSLVITSAVSTIYYTTNGADPRVYGTGAISSDATAYSGPITLSSNTVVKARVRNGSSVWSALTEAEFTVGNIGTPLRFSEIMYNPAPGGAAGDPYEYIELQNIGSVPVVLGGDYFDGITFLFPPGASLSPGARLIVGASDNTNAFKLRYPAATNIAGWFTGRLSNSGERIALLAPNGQTIISVTYGTSGGWPTQPNGGGYSLEIINPSGDPNDPANWRAGTTTNGTPGLPGGSTPTPTIFINEIMADNLTAVTNGITRPDWVELYNPGGSPVNLLNWSLTDSGDARKYVFPNTNIAAGGFLVVWCDAATNTTPGLHTDFALDNDGEIISLFDASTNRVDAVSFGSQLTDFTVGRISGTWQLNTPTLNAANVAATLAASTNLVVNEWLANTLPGQEDWFELYNRSTNLPATLRGVFVGTSNALFQIGSLSFVPPGGFVQLTADEVAGAGHVDFKLPAEGSVIAVYDATALLLDQVVYGPQTQGGVSQGRLPDGSNNITSFPGSASPAASNYLLNYTGAVLNEVLARYDSITNGSDWVELFYSGTNPFDLSGMGLSDDAGNPDQWVFPTNTVMGSNTYLRVWFDNSRPASTSGTNLNTGRGLSGESGGVYLFNTLGQPVSTVEYGFQIKNQSVGLSGGVWQLLATPTPGTNNSAPATLGAATSLRINEWMATVANGGDDWFEFYNTNTLPVSLSGLFISDNPSLVGKTNTQVGPLSYVPPHGWVKWIADDHPSNGRDHVSFHLDELGESLLIYNTNLTLIDSVVFGAQSDGVSQGRLPDGGIAIVSFPTTPTPGKANYLPLASVVINEVLTHTDAPLEDALELFNPNSTNVNIGGWFLSNSGDDLKRFRVTNGTIVPAGGFKVFYENQLNGGTGSVTPFTFNAAHGDEVWLSEADANTNLTGYRIGVEFGAAENGVSLGRYQTTVSADFTALSQRTFGVDNPSTVAQFRTGTGATNDYPKVGPMVINEIMYHPPDIAQGTDFNDDSTNEFIELCNATGSAMPLFDSASPANTWRLANAVDYAFPTNVTASAGERLLVVNFDPGNTVTSNAFRVKYGITGGVRIFGPYSGKLDNSAETIELYKPDPAQQSPQPDAGFVPQVLVDKVAYQDLTPWPSGAVDGGGLSLQRSVATAYGNEPTNWFAGVPTAGQGSASSLAIITHPQSRTVFLGEGVEFTVTAQGAAPLSHQWIFNDDPLMGQTASNLVYANIQLGHAGTYRVQVSNSTGNVVSDDATLTVLALPAGSATVLDSDTVRLSFPVLPGRSYQIEYKSNLDDPEWTALGSPVEAEESPLVLDDDIGGQSQRFYRLVILP